MANFEKFANYQVSDAARNSVGMPRSKFYMPHTLKTTFNVGDLVPLGAPIEILPGDSIDDARTKCLARLSTAKFPTMDNAFVDFYAFFTPWRLLFDKTKEFFGENNENAWTNTDPPLLPHTTLGEVYQNIESWDALDYTLWDYFGLPCRQPLAAGFPDGITINLMPFRGYKLIYNEFFRNQNTTAPLMVNTSGTDTLSEEYFAIQHGCRFHDRFSDCLPSPQKGPDVLIPGLMDIPVVTGELSHGGPYIGLRWRQADGTMVGMTTNNEGDLTLTLPASSAGDKAVFPTNLYTGQASAATIRSLRDAFQIQRIYERDARSGSRYAEYLRAAFDVVSADASLQRPQFLGTHRVALNMSQVVQQSSDVEGSPLGNVAGLSKTYGDWQFPAQGFTEHGYLYVLALARTERSYYGGVNRLFSRLSRFDVYDPALAMISEQPVYTRELSLALGANEGDKVFGYQAPWSEYREIPSWVTGSFRPDADQSLSAWTYVDYYGDQTPRLATSWMEESDQVMANTLAYNNPDQRDQILLDVRFDWQISRCIVSNGIPGLVDHF